MRKTLLLGFAGLLLPGILRAQSVVTITPEQCVWRAGDNPAWAAPGFDDSAWQPYSRFNVRSDLPYIWVRCRADLSPLQTARDPAVQVALYAAYEVFVEGRKAGGAGNMRTGGFTMNTIREWPISADLGRSSAIALRITRRIVSTVPAGALPPLSIRAGPRTILNDMRSSAILAQVSQRIIPAVCFGMAGILGMILLPLWFNDRSRRELLLLCISCVLLPPIYTDYVGAASLFPFPVWGYFLAWALPAAIVNICRALFFFALARKRVPLVFWILIIVGNALYAPTLLVTLLPPAQALWLDALRSHQLEAVGDVFRTLENLAPYVAFLPWNRLTRREKPLAFLSIAWGTAMMLFFAVRFTGANLPGVPNLQLHWSGAVADAEAVSVLSLMVALLFLLFRDQRQVTEERALLAGEMQAAGEIQRMLAPAAIQSAPGLSIQVAFHAMRDVGGDFYLCRVLPDGRQRVLLGDVSGKGTAAAMTATLLLGGASARESDSPAALLGHLNLVMSDMHVGGFATCFCADISSDGRLTIANGGHLYPYCNGEELAFENGLPLGIIAETNYTESTFDLVPGDTLTFVSDGIVEARNSTGELFGFERTRNLSSRPAEEIAQAAQAFGQEDDITVLTVTFAPAEVLHA